MGNVEMCGVYKILNAHERNFYGPGERYLVGPAEKLLWFMVVKF